jgi:hypothetical protein
MEYISVVKKYINWRVCDGCASGRWAVRAKGKGVDGRRKTVDGKGKGKNGRRKTVGGKGKGKNGRRWAVDGGRRTVGGRFFRLLTTGNRQPLLPTTDYRQPATGVALTDYWLLTTGNRFYRVVLH